VTNVEISLLYRVMLHRLEMEALRCLGSRVFNECSADEIQAIKDIGIYSYVTQHATVVYDVCFEYDEGNTGGLNFTCY